MASHLCQKYSLSVAVPSAQVETENEPTSMLLFISIRLRWPSRQTVPLRKNIILGHEFA